MAAEGDLAETSKNQIVDSLPVPVPPKRKKKMKNTEECDVMLEKAFTILTSSAAAAATADDDECRSFGSFISNKLRNYLPCTRNKVQHEISNIIFAADQGHFNVAYPVPDPSPASQVSSPTTPSSFAGSDDIHLSDLMCI
jgi:hypothetical protein